MQNKYHRISKKKSQKGPGRTTDAYLIYSCFLYRTKYPYIIFTYCFKGQQIYYKSDIACLNRLNYECHLNWVGFEFKDFPNRFYVFITVLFYLKTKDICRNPLIM